MNPKFNKYFFLAQFCGTIEKRASLDSQLRISRPINPLSSFYGVFKQHLLIKIELKHKIRTFRETLEICDQENQRKPLNIAFFCFFITLYRRLEKSLKTYFNECQKQYKLSDCTLMNRKDILPIVNPHRMSR